MINQPITFAQFLQQAVEQQTCPIALAELTSSIAAIGIRISALIRTGALSKTSGKTGTSNIQGEWQIAQDVASNDLFIAALRDCKWVAGLASEELESVITFERSKDEGQFLVLFDPLDGSSNADVNVTVGSIFSILPAPKDGAIEEKHFLQAGKHQLAAGYVAYGPSIMLVLSLGQGTHGFTLDDDSATFMLTHPNMHVNQQTSEYAINVSNRRFWEQPIQYYIAECEQGAVGLRGRDFNLRWVASMVADVHRILIRGGVYLYPKDFKQPLREGRLRLMYEANPMAMLVLQAGGACSTGTQDILSVTPDWIHQRVPVMLGSREEIERIHFFYTECNRLQSADAGASPLFARNPLFRPS